MSGTKGRSYRRFSRSQRLQHWSMVTGFVGLALTGLPQKYSGDTWGERSIDWLGGIEFVRVCHRAFAILLMLAAVLHLIDVLYRVLVVRRPLSMLPVLKDVLDAAQTVRYNLGLAKERPQLGRFTFEEKIEYWALLWGTLIMIGTGFMLWNPIATARFFPGQWIPAAQVAHGGEALLAVLAVILWHGYGVHIRHFNRSMFSGRMSEAEMREEHPLELADIAAGRIPPLPDPAVVKRRLKKFAPIAAAIGACLLAGLYWFVTFEQTAIETLPFR